MYLSDDDKRNWRVFILMAITLILIAILTFSCSKDDTPSPITVRQAKCELAPQPGNCKASITKYYFNHITGQCDSFQWGGCNGVVPFETLQECLDCKCD